MTPEPETAFIGVGGNIDPTRNIALALENLTHPVTVTGVSTFYRTKPLKGRKQDEYLNGVWRITTSIPPRDLKRGALADIETSLGRKRSTDRYASRTIDLDLILYGDMVMDEDGLTLPDPDIYTRPFIAVPLFELAPGLVLPDTSTSIRTIAEGFKGDPMIPDNVFTEHLRRIIE